MLDCLSIGHSITVVLRLTAIPFKTRLGAGLPTPPHYGPQVSNRRRKPMRWETFGQPGVRGQETRAQLPSFASLNGIGPWLIDLTQKTRPTDRNPHALKISADFMPGGVDQSNQSDIIYGSPG